MIATLEKLGINNPKACLNKYPHELSGGMQQRILIAIGLLKKPKIIIADEPTTALDSINQMNVMKLLLNLKESGNNTSFLLISHDLSLVKKTCQRVIVLFLGKIVEEGSIEEIFEYAKQPYTQELLNSSHMLVSNENAHINSYNIDRYKTSAQIKIGCPIWYKCKYCMKICIEKNPILRKVSSEHTVACWRYS